MAQSARKRAVVSVGLAPAVATLLAAAYRLAFLSTAQLQSTDFLFKGRSGEGARATVIAAVDQPSYRELLPRYGTLVDWPRTLYAQALDALRQAGPRVVIFDDPKPEDRELAAAIKRAGNVVMPAEAEGPGGLAPQPGVVQR